MIDALADECQPLDDSEILSSDLRNHHYSVLEELLICQLADMLGHEYHIRLQFVYLLQVGLQNRGLVLNHGVETSLAGLQEAFSLNGRPEDQNIRVFDVCAKSFGRYIPLEYQPAHAGCSHAISRSRNGEHPNLFAETERLWPYKSVHLYLVDRLQCQICHSLRPSAAIYLMPGTQLKG